MSFLLEDMMETEIDLRPSPIAGQWYPRDRARLSSSISQYLDSAAPANIDGEVIALVVPHAGHIYSGPVAGSAFALVRGLKPDLVAVISPMHQPYHHTLITTGHQAYSTPLGEIHVDEQRLQNLNEILKSELGQGLVPIRNDGEHSLEIELPFLQSALEGEFKLLPIMMRDQSANVARLLGEALAKTLQGLNALLVASTDLSHFYSQREATLLDQEMLNRLEAFDPMAIIQAEVEGKGFACGRGAMAAVLWAARDLGANGVKILDYATSGDITGDYSRVVGYGAAAVIRSNN